MALVALLTFCALLLGAHTLAHSAQHALQTMEVASELAADRSLSSATSLLNGLEDDIGRLWTALPPCQHEVLHGTIASLVQLNSELSAQPTVAKPALAHKKGIDATTAVKEMANLKPGQMAPMLGLITGMYDNWKQKIGEANKKEHEQKVSFDKTIKDLDAKKAMYKDSKDAMDTYDRIEKYWKRQRSISHRQYHTALKIMHSGMQKFKAVSGAMQNAIAGKKPTAKDLQAVGMAMPDVVLLQREVQGLSAWTQAAAKEISGAKSPSA